MLSALRTGLRNLRDILPLLGGSVETVSPEEVKTRGLQRGWKEIKPNDAGLELVIKDLSSDMPSFEEMRKREFPASMLPGAKLIPVPLAPVMAPPFSCAKFQLNFIQGGALLSVCIVHAVADGNGMDQLVGMLAEECRLADAVATGKVTADEGVGEVRRKVRVEGPLGMDRSAVIDLPERPTTIEEHPGYVHHPDPDEVAAEAGKASTKDGTVATPASTNSADSTDTNSDDPPPPEKHLYLLEISASNLMALKTAATGPTTANTTTTTNSTATTPWISTHDAIEALIWRSLLLSRQATHTLPLPSSSPSNPESTTSKFLLSTNARKHLSPPLPQNSYLGNCTYFVRAELPLSTLLSADDPITALTTAAHAIRTAISSVTQEKVAEINTLMRNLPHVNMIFLSVFETAGGTDVCSGSMWRSDTIYNSTWGEAFGEEGVVRMRCPGDVGFMASMIDVVQVLPRVLSGENEGAAEVTVALSRDGLEVLRRDELWKRFVRVIDGPEGTVLDE